MAPRMSRLMTLREVADMLGMDGVPGLRRLTRQLKRLERRSGKKILLETGDGKGKRYLVTLATLRENYPDLFYRRDEVVEKMREYVEELDEQFADVNDRIEAVAAMAGQKIRGLDERVTKIEGRLRTP